MVLLNLIVVEQTLYSTHWRDIVEELLNEFKSEITSISRLDIALDGLNHIPLFLNCYTKQMPHKTKIEMKGKARLNGSVFDKSSKMFQAFRIGSGTSPKILVVYNKTSELKHSCKEYIRDVWVKSGLDVTGEVWRSELRMRSKSLKEIKDFDLGRCSDPHYLMSIFKTQTKNFVEFVKIKADTNISRMETINLFQFDKLQVTLLDKIPRVLEDTIYKAKLSIHQAVADCIRETIPQEEKAYCLRHMVSIMDAYDLRGYYTKKLPEWHKRYCSAKAPPEILENLLQYKQSNN